MPQVKIIGMYLVCWQLFLLPTITPGVECAFDLFRRHDQVSPWVLDQLQSKLLVIYMAWEGRSCFHQGLRTCSEMYNGREVHIQTLLQTFFQHIKDHQFWRPVQGDMAETLSVAHSENYILHHWSKKDTTLLFGTHFMRMMAHWKHNFMNFNLEWCFSTCSILEVKEKLWKMRQLQGRDESRSWRRIGTMAWW
jgi:hypothetical protein